MRIRVEECSWGQTAFFQSGRPTFLVKSTVKGVGPAGVEPVVMYQDMKANLKSVINVDYLILLQNRLS